MPFVSRQDAPTARAAVSVAPSVADIAASPVASAAMSAGLRNPLIVGLLPLICLVCRRRSAGVRAPPVDLMPDHGFRATHGKPHLLEQCPSNGRSGNETAS